MLDNRQPAKTMAWALVIYFVPIFGVVAYIFFGVNRRKERFIGRRSMDMLTKRSMLEFVEQRHTDLPEAYESTISLFSLQGHSMPFINQKTDILTSGYEFFPLLLRDISAARSHIHIDMYIFEDDALGLLVSDALIARAREGVEVRIIYDDVGCWKVKKYFWDRMRDEGIDIEPFMRVRFPRFTSRVNYRNHRKVIVIDGSVGYIGGMNIALRYVKGRGNSDGWRDTMLRLEGGAVNGLQQIFLLDWYFVDRTLLSDKKYYTKPGSEGALLQAVTSGPVDTYPEIMQGYLSIIMSARRYIYFETPYFLPPDAVLLAMKTAAASGVDVRLLVPHSPDAYFVEWASRSYLREAVEAGIKVNLYEGSFLHSKLMVCDDAVCTCGSTNLDFRSFENNFEANAFIYDADVARRMCAVFLDDESRSVALTSLPERISPSFLQRIWDSLTRLFSPLL